MTPPRLPLAALLATLLLALAAGPAHAAVAPSAIAAWGLNDNGQLGTATPPLALAPQAVPGLYSAVAVAGGGYFSLALDADGHVWSWGLDDAGQLGDGTTTAHAAPAQLAGLDHVVAIAAGFDHGVALRDDGTVVTWGDNASGQLGDGTTDPNPTPTAVTGLDHVVAIAAGFDFTLALLDDGTIRTWGGNDVGQLGDGTIGNETSPTTVTGITTATAITAGASQSFALLADGSVMAWGGDWTGQLGDGTTNDSSTPVAVSGIADATAIAAGGYHTLALLADGSVVGWGLAAFGQLGSAVDAAGGQTGVPTAVTGLAGITQVAAGFYDSYALDGDGRAWALGEGDHGELGDGAGAALDATPVHVAGVHVAALGQAMTASHALAILVPDPPTAAPAGLTFATQALGTLSAAQTVTIAAGPLPVHVARIATSGAAREDFVLVADDCTGVTLAPGEQCAVGVRFAPSATGARSAVLVAVTDAAANPQVALAGNGGEAPQGATGPQGPAGTSGSAGATGSPGPHGAKGPRGAAGRDAIVSCRLVRTHVACSVRLHGAGTRARLVRAGRTYASGTLAHLRLRRALVPGRYTLIAGRGRARVRAAVRLRSSTHHPQPKE